MELEGDPGSGTEVGSRRVESEPLAQPPNAQNLQILPPNQAWSCILCGGWNSGAVEPVTREQSLCVVCRSTWRARAVVLGLLIGLGYRPGPLPSFPPDWSRRGIGCSDDVTIASRLPGYFSYSNTYYDQFPHLDLADPAPNAIGQFEFVTCSDVLEHVTPPVHNAMAGLSRCLRDGGFAVITVPTHRSDETIEFYDGLVDYRLDETD
jgi:SAM-dependent methyltransferase